MLYNMTFPAFTQQVAALSAQLGKAAEWCTATGTSEADLLATRLAPDMATLARQVAFVANQVAGPVRRLTGADIADFDEAAPTIAAQQALLADALALVNTVTPAAIDTDTARRVGFTLPNGMAFDMTAADYVRDWALPQFYFHIVTAYALMRSRGVALGKIDYVPYMMRHMAPPPV
jgi:uncharacterized protein